LRQATAESTDYYPEKVADGQQSKAIGAAARPQRIGVRKIQRKESKIRKDVVSEILPRQWIFIWISAKRMQYHSSERDILGISAKTKTAHYVNN